MRPLGRYKLNRMTLPAFTDQDSYKSGRTDFPVDPLAKVWSLRLVRAAASGSLIPTRA